MANIRKGKPKPRTKSKKPVPTKCPCCGGELASYARKVRYITSASHERHYRVCKPCGIRVVLFAFPPGRTYR